MKKKIWKKTEDQKINTEVKKKRTKTKKNLVQKENKKKNKK